MQCSNKAKCPGVRKHVQYCPFLRNVETLTILYHLESKEVCKYKRIVTQTWMPKECLHIQENNNTSLTMLDNHESKGGLQMQKIVIQTWMQKIPPCPFSKKCFKQIKDIGYILIYSDFLSRRIESLDIFLPVWDWGA